MLGNFIDYNPVKNVYKNQKTDILLNEKAFYKGIKEVLIAFEENILNHMCLKKLTEKKRYAENSKKKSFLNELGCTELSEKENELLNKHFSFENVD